MDYTRPTPTEADVSWFGASSYTMLLSSEADASFGGSLPAYVLIEGVVKQITSGYILVSGEVKAINTFNVLIEGSVSG